MNRETFLEVVKYIKSIIKNTEYENHTYVVGGACRDYVLNANIKDIDLVVDLPNGGIKFGVTFGEDIDLCIGFISTYIEAYNLGTEYQEWLKCFTDRVNELKVEGTMFDHTTVLPIDGNDIMKRFKLKPSKEVKKLLDEAWNIYYNNPKISKDNLVSYLQRSNIICG